MINVVVVGNGEMASAVLLGVIESGHKAVGVLRWEKVETLPLFLKLKDIFNPSKFLSLIKSYKIYDINANSVNSEKFKKEILKLNPDIIIVASWGEKLKKEAILLPQIACINCHPALLPQHRGPNPYYSTIKENEKRTGVTFHLMDENYDTGPILLQKEVTIFQEDTGGTLKTRCCQCARASIKELLEGLEQAKYMPTKQNESKASYFNRIDAQDVLIRFSQSPESIYNKIRGMNPWNHCYMEHGDEFFKVGSCKIVDLKEKMITVEAKQYLLPEIKNSQQGQVLLKGNNWLLVSSINPQKALLFEKVELLGFLKKALTAFYIKHFVKIAN